MTQQPVIDEYGYPLPPGSRRQLRNFVVHNSRHVLLTVISLMMHLIGMLLRWQRHNQQLSPLNTQTFQPQRILVIRVDLIGDLVMSLTAVRALKRSYPQAQIDLLATPASAKIITSDPDLHSVIAYDPNIWRRPQALIKLKNWRELLKLRHHLQQQHYDLAVSLFGPWASILAVLSRARRTVGFADESYPGFFTDPVPGRHWREGEKLHEVDYCLQLARAAGADVTPAERVPSLVVDPSASKQVEEILHKEGMQDGKPIIACHVSANNGQSKRWPVPYWATLMDRLLREDGSNVVLTGGPGDLPLITAICEKMRARPINLAGKTTLPQLAALLQRADLLVTGDSGPMHIAGAVGTSLIAIHGPTDPAHSGPVTPEATILRDDSWCSPCYMAKGPADCRFFTTQCMKNISPNQVYTLIHEKLGEPMQEVSGPGREA